MKNKSLLFWDLMAGRYSKQPVADEAAYQKKLEKTREYLTPNTELLSLVAGLVQPLLPTLRL